MEECFEDFIEMETICEDYENMALAGSSMNTIRQYKGRYLDLRPGDHVRMYYRSAVGEEPFAQEELVVTSIAVSDLSNLLDQHGEYNHGKYVYNEEDFGRIYGTTDGQFCAIYFW